MNEQSIREAIETLERGEQCTCNNPTIICRYCEAVTTVRNCLNLILSVKGVGKMVNNGWVDEQRIIGFNDCHDKFTALRAKQLMEVENLLFKVVRPAETLGTVQECISCGAKRFKQYYKDKNFREPAKHYDDCSFLKIHNLFEERK